MCVCVCVCVCVYVLSKLIICYIMILEGQNDCIRGCEELDYLG